MDAVDELYATPPDGFVAARDVLVAAAKARGDKQEIAALKKLRRPSVPAWALNALARARSDEVGALAELAARVRRVQRRALSGVKDSGLKDALEERRVVVTGLLRAAEAILRDAGKDDAPHRAALHGALLAATADEQIARALAEGRLVQAPEPPTWFGEAPLTVVQGGGGKGAPDDEASSSRSSSPKASSSKGATKAPAQRDVKGDAARAKAAAAEAREEAAAARKEAKRQAAEDARREREEAAAARKEEARRARAEHALRAAEQRRDEAARALAEIDGEVAKLAVRRARAEEQLAKATHAVEEAAAGVEGHVVRGRFG